MRVCAVSHQQVRHFDHQRRGIRMQVETSDQRLVGPDEIAHPAQQLALSILEMLGHHGAMQTKVDGIIGRRVPQPVEDLASDMFERMFGHDIGRRRGAPGQRVREVVQRFDPLHKPGYRQVLALDAREKVRPGRQRRAAAAHLERFKPRLCRRERIRFVLNATDHNKRHRPAPPLKSTDFPHCDTRWHAGKADETMHPMPSRRSIGRFHDYRRQSYRTRQII